MTSKPNALWIEFVAIRRLNTEIQRVGITECMLHERGRSRG